MTDIFYFANLSINPCHVCNACENLGRCAQEDDMQFIHEALMGSDVIVLGTPIYHDHVSAQAKIFTDRLYAYEWKDSLPKGMKAVIAITYEWDNPTGYDHVLEWIKVTLQRYYGIDTVATLKAHGTSKNPVGERPELLRAAQAMGADLAGMVGGT
jgi:multimeric flavodoxin WrbA